MRRNLLAMTLTMLIAPAALAAEPSAADPWPTRPIRIVVGYSPGSTGDNVVRLLANELRPQLGQPVVIENRSGAGGNIAAEQVVNATPDGYTLFLGAANNFAANQFLYRNLGFDPQKDFEPVTALVDVPAVVYINGGLKVGTFQQFTAEAKTKKGRWSYGSPGSGTPPHLAAELINQAAGWQLLHVPYRGSPQSVAALLAGDVQLILGGLGVGLQHVKAGKLKAIAVGAPQRLPELPDVPTLSELGMGQIKASTWWGLAAPKGTPQPMVAKLRQAFGSAIANPNIQDQLRQLGTLPLSGDTADMSRLMAEDSAYWGTAIKRLGVRLE